MKLSSTSVRLPNLIGRSGDLPHKLHLVSSRLHLEMNEAITFSQSA